MGSGYPLLAGAAKVQVATAGLAGIPAGVHGHQFGAASLFYVESIHVVLYVSMVSESSSYTFGTPVCFVRLFFSRNSLMISSSGIAPGIELHEPSTVAARTDSSDRA